MSLDESTALIAEFLAAEKTARVRPRWRSKGHSLYAEARMVVGLPNVRRLTGMVYITAHRVRDPAKYGFALSFRGQRILSLDVSPARHHKNLFASVNGTHWQRWPDMDAVSDERDQDFDAWLKEFLQVCNIVPTFRLLSPPRGVQLRLIK